MGISAIIIAKNEEKKIGDCLKSVSWADETIIVDSGSVDKTIPIAKMHATKVIRQLSGGFSERRNRGLKEARGEWIFYIDADERATRELRDEIHKLITNTNYSAYAIPRRNIILGREMKHGGWWPDYVKRLFLKSKFKGWTGELHEEPNFEGKLGHLKASLTHVKHDNLSEMVEKTNNWSEIEARLMFEAGHPPMNISRFFTAGLREFWLRMIRHAAFLDGVPGIIYALYQVFSRLVSYTKLWEMQLKIPAFVRTSAGRQKLKSKS